MATKNQRDRRKDRKKLRNELEDLGIGGSFAELIDAAVRGDWSDQELIVRLTKTKQFRRQFPGLILRGELNSMLTGQEEATINFTNLATALKNYRTVHEQYQQIAEKYGYGGVGRDRLNTLLRSEVSPDEFGSRLAAVTTVQKNKDVFDAFAKQAKLAGVTMTPKDMFAFAARTADAQFYDIYEAAQLQSQVGLKARDAAKLAKNVVGLPGEATQSLDEIIGYVRQNLQQIGPELQRQGINAAKLVKVMANPGSYASEMDKIRQTVATREGLGRPVAGIYAQQGSGGGPSLYQDQGEASYG